MSKTEVKSRYWTIKVIQLDDGSYLIEQHNDASDVTEWSSCRTLYDVIAILKREFDNEQ